MYRLLILPVALLLTACFGSEGNVDALTQIQSARSGVRISSMLAGKVEAAKEKNIPASTAGVKASAMLSRMKTTTDIISGADGERNELQEDTALLEKLLNYLSRDIQVLLNNAINREGRLELYIESVESDMQKGHIRLSALQNQKDDLEDDERRLNRSVREMRDELDDTIRKGQGSKAIALTEELIRQQTEFAKVQTDLIVASHLVEAFGDILEPLEERLRAIKLNKKPLIKGIHVIDIKGIDDLGIIRDENGIPRIKGKGRRRF